MPVVQAACKVRKRVHEIESAGAPITCNVFDYNSRILPVLSYVSQLVPPSENFAFIRRVALHTIYRMPSNTFAHFDFFKWAHVRLPKVRCGIAACYSALCRTSLCTLVRWRQWLRQVKQVSRTHLPIAMSFSTNPSLSPPGWDSISFAEHLFMANKGVFRDFDMSTSLVIQKYRDRSRKLSSNSPQKKISQAMIDFLHVPGDSSDLHVILTRRINKLFYPYQLDYVGTVNLQQCVNSLNMIPDSARVKVVKTWLNGWATSSRIKGNFQRTCLLGCPDAFDSVAHYLMCPKIYAVGSFVLPSTSTDPLIRCGLCRPSKESLLAVACTFCAYHALKARINTEFDECIPENFDYTRMWIFFAQAFAAEAVAVGIYCSLFDPDSFLNRSLHLLGP